VLPGLKLRIIVVRPTEVKKMIKLLRRPLIVGEGAAEKVVLS
jgi:hypothetical protein